METVSRICNCCYQAFQSIENLISLTSEKGYQHYDRQSLINSASQGCRLCTIIWDVIGFDWDMDEDEVMNQILFLKAEFEYQDDHEDGEQCVGIKGHPFRMAENGARIQLYLSSGDDRRLMTTISFLPITPSDDPAAKYIKQRPIPIDLSAEYVKSQMKTWLNECRKGHTCSPDTPVSPLPTRVLDVAGPQPRLHVSSENEMSDYVALSYCWGGPQKVLTTTESLESNIKGLPFNKLPSTLQDAIQVTRTLGFSYLWIDALCIIQDSLEDKSTEINKMGSIYQNATLTIFAANASSVNQGFLQPRIPDEGIVLPFYVSENVQGTITLLLEDLSYIPDDPLDARAWVLQETLLSRRRLIFSTRELLWRCGEQEYRRVNSSPRYYVPLAVHFPNDTFHPAPRNGFNFQTPEQVDQSHVQTWNMMVQDLTSRGITEKDDRLPAISGIASELQKLWKDKYIVGLWRYNLASHLCWRRVTSHHTSSLPRPAVYRAPTWSWASVDCAVEFRNIEIVEVEVLQCFVRPKSPLASFGWASEAHVVLKAKVIAIADVGAKIWEDGKLVQDVEADQMSTTDTYLMLVGFQIEWAAVGLILKLMEDGTFVRIGSFFHRDNVHGLVPGGAGSLVWRRPEVVFRELTIL